MPETDGRPERADCVRHQAGHTPHFIQVRLARQCPPDDWRRVVVLGTDGDVVVLAVDKGVRRYRNHETAVLDWMVGRVGPEAMLNIPEHALFCRPRPCGGSAVFSLQDTDAEPLSCRPREEDR
jgi:hypothetical protein